MVFCLLLILAIILAIAILSKLINTVGDEKLVAYHGNKNLARRTKQFGIVLDVTTAFQDVMKEKGIKTRHIARCTHHSRGWVQHQLSNNITVLGAAELADALGLELKISLNPKGHTSPNI